MTPAQQFWQMQQALAENLMIQQYWSRHLGRAFALNPVDYASQLYRYYIEKYFTPKQNVLFVGMNPGPNGMGQNGVPFGNTWHVQNFLDIRGMVNQPTNLHRKYVIEGLAYNKTEKSGLRFWGLMKQLCETPENFFRNCFVYNYCPLLFLHECRIKNISIPELRWHYRKALQMSCDYALKQCIEIMKPTIVVGIGGYAEDCIERVKRTYGLNIKCAKIRHPAANGGVEMWEKSVRQQLKLSGVMQYLQPPM